MENNLCKFCEGVKPNTRLKEDFCCYACENLFNAREMLQTRASVNIQQGTNRTLNDSEKLQEIKATYAHWGNAPIKRSDIEFLISQIEKKEEVTILSLCEVSHIFLRPDQLYKFVEMPSCAECKRLAEVFRLSVKHVLPETK